MTKEEIKPYVEKYARLYGLKPEIVYGVCVQESGLNPYAARFEPNYKWLFRPSKVKPLLCSAVTEETCQKISWGLMQIMGAVFRELGFQGWLTEVLSSIDIQLDYGCRLLSVKINKYGLHDGILSYNSGSPIKGKDGKFINEHYYEGVIKHSQTY